jgi:metal-dependent amidase/aminoacylase/carboxypeptidase family protein
MSNRPHAAEIHLLVEQVAPQMVEWRRHLHMHPELPLEEHGTARYISGVLARLSGIEVTSPTPTSVMAVLRGGGD